MTPLTLRDLLAPDLYEDVRDDYRRAILAHKHPRRVPVGEHVTLVFEDRETLRWQVLEMARVERLRDEGALQHELDVYNELLPSDGGLSATLFIEITDQASIRPQLDRLIGLDEHVSIQVGDGQPVQARFDDRQLEEERISAVHYVQFPLGEADRTGIRDGAATVVRIDHPHYRAEQLLARATLASLAVDVTGDPVPLLDVEAQRRAAADDVVEATPTLRVTRAGADLVIEPRAAGPTFLSADAGLIAELTTTAQRHARSLPGCRIEQSPPDAPLRWVLRAGAY